MESALGHFPKWRRPGIHWYSTHFRKKRGNGWGTEVYGKTQNALAQRRPWIGSLQAGLRQLSERRRVLTLSRRPESSVRKSPQYLTLLLLLSAVPAACQDANPPIYSEVIPTSSGLAYNPATDYRETFQAPNGK